MAKTKRKNTNYIHKNNLRDLVNAWKQRHGCSICKREFDPAVLDCHHIDKKTKLFTISVGVSTGVSTERIQSELMKCEIHCANCHRRREAFQRMEQSAKGIKSPRYNTLPGIWENKFKERSKVWIEFEPDRALF